MKTNVLEAPVRRTSRWMVVSTMICASGAGMAQAPAPTLTPLPESKPPAPAMVALGKALFFDNRLAGDWGSSCASCHDPKRGFGDGQPLSAGYTSMEYFRNAPTLINARYRTRFMWDGRLDGADAGTAVRDMITEAHFMNADGRIVQERLKQIPEYLGLWEAAFGKGSDPYSPRMFNAIGAFVQSLESKNAAFDRFAKGDQAALDADAKAGLAVFNGKGQCVQCHNGPIGSDGKFHRLGVPEHPDVLGNPLRTITMLRHYSTSGMPNYMAARTDVGFYAISKDPKDIGRFQTPSLRELKVTAPYMHNGVFKTLEEEVDFYDRGGGGKGTDLKPLGNAAANLATVWRGIPNFFTPNLHALRGSTATLGVEGAAYYSTAPLRDTLLELVDFEYLCECRTRMTVGAVNVVSGAMRYFDTRKERLTVEHVMASGALPPAFGAIRIDGEPYWDGGIYSNTPIEAVLDDKPRRDSLIFAVNVWHQQGPEPESIWQVMGRQKDIQYASRADSHIARQKQIHRLRHVIRELHARIPAAQRNDAQVKELASWGCGTTVHVAHLVAPRLEGEDHTKDIDFTPAGVRARRQAGYADTLRMIERAPWNHASADPIEGVIEHS